MIRILVVDDEIQLLRALRINLSARHYEVVTAQDGAAALDAAAKHAPDLVVLDLGLPDMDGANVIAGLRGWTKIPILVLSGRADAAEKVAALDAGADDYVTKPFSMDELLARIRALIRRVEADAATTPVTIVGHHAVDLAARTVTPAPDAPILASEPVHLTKTEWAMLEILLRNPGRLVSGRQILLEIWGPAYENQTNYLRFYMGRLRQKLEPEPSRPRQLLTEPGMGYRFQP
jgi:two-component system KDP operon response regulator KdpE